MKTSYDLSIGALQAIVDKVQCILWEDLSDDGKTIVWNPDKEWSPDTLDQIAEVLANSELNPIEEG